MSRGKTAVVFSFFLRTSKQQNIDEQPINRKKHKI
jgi:hypothetical protein